MCGIAGIYHHNQLADLETVAQMTDAISHRGPDDVGVLQVAPFLAFGHRRLSIMDLSQQGHQPIQTRDKRITLSYNGELYNYRELRVELERIGYQFQSDCDTEVVLNSFHAWGIDAFLRWNGMFAAAFWDHSKQSLYLVRDRFGIKPLYYYRQNQLLLFASEVKAFYAHPLFQTSVHDQGLSEFLWYGAGLGANTLYAGVKKLLPGHFMQIKNGACKEEVYWAIESVKSPSNLTLPDVIAQTRVLFQNAVKRHLQSDVPVGVFLSGGIDSSAITAMASQHSADPINTYAVGFDHDKGVNELSKAASVAKKYGTNHHELHIAGADLPDTISKLVSVHDEPFADAANIPLYLLCQQLHGSIKVVLQGDGGDEIFGGYRRYNVMQYEMLWHYASKLGLPVLNFLPKHPIVSRITRFMRVMAKSTPAERMALMLTVDSFAQPPTSILSNNWKNQLAGCDPFSRYRECAARFVSQDSVQRMLYTDASVLLADIFLEKVDKPTMANSIEVRVPFLDAALTDYVLSLPSNFKIRHREKKWLLREAMRGVVPDAILDAPKTGFGVPFSYWLKTSLLPFLRDVLLDKSQTLFDQILIEKMILQHAAGQRDYGFLLWKALLLALWHRGYSQRSRLKEFATFAHRPAVSMSLSVSDPAK